MVDEENVIEDKGIDWELLVKGFSILGGIISAIIIWFVIDKTIYFILGILVIAIISILIYKAFSIYRKLEELRDKETKGMPEPKSSDKHLEKIKEKLLWEKKNHIKDVIKSYSTVQGSGERKTKIYVWKVRLLYPEEYRDKKNNVKTEDEFWIFKNAHKLDSHIAISPDDLITKKDRKNILSRMAENPEREPDVERREWVDPITDRTFKEERKIRNKKKNNKKDKGGDLE
ncbi:MAG: hypothetical protein ACOCRO_10375 [Halanaerobiales bacterium]